MKGILNAAKAALLHSVMGIVHAELAGGKGEWKKQRAIAFIQADLDKVAPAWAVPVLDAALPKLIDLLVGYLNQSGLFEKLVGQLAAAAG